MRTSGERDGLEDQEEIRTELGLKVWEKALEVKGKGRKGNNEREDKTAIGGKKEGNRKNTNMGRKCLEDDETE